MMSIKNIEMESNSKQSTRFNFCRPTTISRILIKNLNHRHCISTFDEKVHNSDKKLNLQTGSLTSASLPRNRLLEKSKLFRHEKKRPRDEQFHWVETWKWLSFCFQHGNSALHEASWRGYSRTVAALAKALGTQRAPLHAKNLAGFAPLHLACQNGHNQTCRELLLSGCNPDLQNNVGALSVIRSTILFYNIVDLITICIVTQIFTQ